MEEYELLLSEAFEKVKPLCSKGCFDRWDVAKPNIQYSGNKTIISNFTQICSCLRRDCEHILKFLSKELASFSKIENDRLIINNKISCEKLSEKINLYISKFVICQECKKPDTELVKKDGFIFINCLACGAKHSLGRA
jgi:translation initiation factor 2 subunit 2